MSNQYSRVAAIDYMKSFLVIGMIFGHTIQFLNARSGSMVNALLVGFSAYIDLITFPGFLFCFGYACYVAYLRKESKEARPKIFRTAIKILLAYYISAFAFKLLRTDGFTFTAVNCIDLLVFNDVPLYSEFFLPFFIIALLLIPCFSFVKNNIGNFYFVLMMVLCILSPFLIPYQKITNHQLALLIGTDQFNNFPVVPYLPYFLIGAWFAKKNVQLKSIYFLFPFLLTSLCGGYIIFFKHSPSRFPPSFFWIAGSAFFLYCYYAAATWIQNKNIHFGFLLSIGKNILFYVLACNLILFSLAGSISLKGDMNIIMGISIVCSIYLVNYLIHLLKKNGQRKFERH